MNKEQALQIIKQIGAAYRGNFEEHQNIQSAIQVIEGLLVEKKPKEEKK